MEFPVFFSNEHGNFMAACKKGDVAEVEKFLNSGQNVDNYNIFGESCLPVAARAGHLDVVKLAVGKYGADVNQRHFHRKSALHEAADKGHLEIVEYLLEHEADPNNTRMFLNPALHKAVRNGHVEVVEALLKHGADPFDHSLWSESAFEIAVKANNTAMIKAIFDVSVSEEFNGFMDHCDELFAPEIAKTLLNNNNYEAINHIRDKMEASVVQKDSDGKIQEILDKESDWAKVVEILNNANIISDTCPFYYYSDELHDLFDLLDANVDGETLHFQDEL